MHNDCFTHGHTQWFYFSVKNVVLGQAVIFNIKNFTKSESLFAEGMRPLLLSMQSKRGWVRAGTSIKYCYSAGNNNNTNSSISDNFQPISQNVQPGHSPSPSLQTVDGSNVQAGGPSNKKDGKECLSDNPIKAPSSVQSKQQQQQTISQSSKPGSYALTFSHTFEFSEDLCYFAYCLPYTYTDLRKYLNAVSKLQGNQPNISYKFFRVFHLVRYSFFSYFSCARYWEFNALNSFLILVLFSRCRWRLHLLDLNSCDERNSVALLQVPWLGQRLIFGTEQFILWQLLCCYSMPYS